jgi:hypothetical protein
MSANQASLSSYGCIRARPGPGFHSFTFSSNASNIVSPSCLLSASKEVGLVEHLFVVFQKRLLEEFVAGESVVVGFAGENVDRLEWVNEYCRLVGGSGVF